MQCKSQSRFKLVKDYILEAESRCYNTKFSNTIRLWRIICSLLKSIEAYKQRNVNEIWISVLTNTKLTKVVETRKQRVSEPVHYCQ